ncbi:hypothetical protein [Marinicella meishanensis]|uniref:hypothetical protein n=1 Tax=Marinicella meishanensis TaxID=2873263 RepID=UPI001CBB32EF|nr:hypothetical protein [Marinicella sp. NBU2979]
MKSRMGVDSGGTQFRGFSSGLSKDGPFAVLAFVVWGGWALYANFHAGFVVAVISAVFQGTFSLVMTLCMGFLTAFLYHRLAVPWLQLVMPALLISLLALGCLTLLHHVIGTPEIMMTIWPALVVGYGFCLYRTIQLRKEGSK